jgi:hypothetical protein
MSSTSNPQPPRRFGLNRTGDALREFGPLGGVILDQAPGGNTILRAFNGDGLNAHIVMTPEEALEFAEALTAQHSPA